MLEFLKHLFTIPPEPPGEYTDADERILEHDNARYAANLETEKRLQDMPRTRWRIWFFFF